MRVQHDEIRIAEAKCSNQELILNWSMIDMHAYISSLEPILNTSSNINLELLLLTS